MKKYLLIAFAAVAAFAFTSCEKPGEQKEDKVSFLIEVSNLEAKGATVTVTASDSNKLFYFDIFAKEELAEASIENLIADYVGDIRAEYDEYANEYAQEYGINSWAELVVAYASKGTDSYDYNLNPESEYVVWACVIDSNFNTVGEIATKNFTTPAKAPAQSIGAISFDVTENDTAYFFTPKFDKSYLASFADKADLAAQGATPADMIEYAYADAAQTAQVYSQYLGMEITVEDFSYAGEIYVSKSSLTAGSTYVFVAQAVAENDLISDLYVKEFTYGKKAPARMIQKGNALHRVAKQFSNEKKAADKIAEMK